MTHFDVATAAVEAALAAGARYADARVMHRRSESMSARNGEIEELSQDENAGVGVRALVGSSWGFFATPATADPDTTAGAGMKTAECGRPAGGERATAIARASARVPGPDVDLVPTEVDQDSWASGCVIDPLGGGPVDQG